MSEKRVRAAGAYRKDPSTFPPPKKLPPQAKPRWERLFFSFLLAHVQRTMITAQMICPKKIALRKSLLVPHQKARKLGLSTSPMTRPRPTRPT